MKWARRIGIGLFVAFFGIACGAVLLFNLSALGWKALSVPTGSMRPTIPPGSLVLMHRVPVSTIKNGDVITYINPLNMRKTITHRVVKTYKMDGKIPAFVTKGDANLSPDQPVIGGQVLGKAVWHTPHLGAWMSWSKTWVGIAILVYIPALLIEAEQVMHLANYWRSLRPYVLPGFKGYGLKSKTMQWLAFAKISAVVLFVGGLVVALPAQALLGSNPVTLANNTITVAVRPPVTHCSNNNNVNISNNSNQTATTGTATGNSASSGNTSNSSSSSINITINNSCP